ncbi:MAG: glycosyltransferase, partial [Pseudonocardiaceae bacterium]
VLRRPLRMARLASEMLEPLCHHWGVDLGPHAGLYRHLHLDACPFTLQDPLIGDIPSARSLRNTDDLDTADGDILPPWIADLGSAPTVYATLGTVFNRQPRVFTALLEGLGRSSINVIATIGHDNDPAALGPQPTNVHLERYIPLSLLLPHLDAVATQGGTSILPALGAGLPLLVMPQGADQFHNAEACVRAGVGRQLLPHELDAEAVNTEIGLLLESELIRKRAIEIQDEFKAMPSPADGVLLLERLVSGEAFNLPGV